MTDKDKLDRAIREAELARSDYFDGKVGDADYILRVLSLFTDVAGDVIAQQFLTPEASQDVPEVRSNILPFTPRGSR